MSGDLAGFTFAEPREASDYLRTRRENYFLHAGQSWVFEHILAGLDLALWDLSLRDSGQSFAEYKKLGRDSARS